MSSMKESLYIIKRRIDAFIYGIPFFICRLFPVQKNKIILWTFEGTGGYGCSPRYIAEELLKDNHEGNNSYQLYWLVTDMNKEFPKEIHKVQDTWLNRAYHMTTAKIWIGNSRTFFGTRKRKETKYIQTWHGSLSLKPIGKYRGEHFSRIAYLVSQADSRLIDVLTPGSKYCAEMWKDGLIYDNDIEVTGTPRCDVLINEKDSKHKQFREEYGLPLDSKIAIYAPTFRGGSQGTHRSISEGVITIDLPRVLDSLEKKFGGSWYIFLRLHPQLSVFMDGMTVDKNERFIDVTNRPDMNEIMAATDCIITDYSTCIFEGCLTGQPGFIYADDLNDYIKDRGSLMFEINTIPFSAASSNDELINNIFNYNEQNYIEKMQQFLKDKGMQEDGHASARIVELIKMMTE